MRIHPKNPIYLMLVVIAFFLSISCNKDSDLLAEYVVEDPKSILLSDIVISTLTNQSIVIDPIDKETYKEPDKVIITEVTPPKMGSVEVKEDNTIIYTPESEKTGTDAFDYTTSVTNPDKTVSTQTGKISVTVTDKTTTDPNAVNFSKYGAVGDGKTDDTKALQAALNANSNLVANAGAIFKISSTLNINQKIEHKIDWNSSKIIASKNLNIMIYVNKRNLGKTAMTTFKNLTVDGSKKAMRGIQIESIVNFNNVDITNLTQYIEQSPAGIYINIFKDENAYGTWIFDGCDITNIVAKSNGTVASDTWGSANGILFYWRETPNKPTKILFKNGIIENIWGEDAGGFFANDPTNKISQTDSKIVVENYTIRNAERRQLKGFSSNLEFNRVTFADPDKNNPNIQKGTTSGMVVFGTDDRKNITFNNCDFIGSGYDGRVIPIGVNDFLITNSRFHGNASIAFTKNIGNGFIKDCEFKKGSIIYAYNANIYGNIVIDSKNRAQKDYIKLDKGDYLLD